MIAILYDTEGWAQHRHAAGLQKYGRAAGYEVSIGRLGRSGDLIKKAKILYTIYFAGTRKIKDKTVASCVASHAWKYKEEDPKDWRTLGTNQTRNHMQGVKHLRGCDVAICRNTSLQKWAEANGHQRAKYIPAGVDTAIFHPSNRSLSPRIRIGWCGQAVAEFKGYHSVFLPLRRQLSGENFEWHQITHGVKDAFTPVQMADWYRNIDVFLTTASDEGTPNPPFEAAACGCVVVSTDMGQPSDWTALRENGLLVPTYRNQAEAKKTVDCFGEKLKALQESGLSQFQEKLLESVESVYDYRVVAPQTLGFIQG